MDLPKIDQMGWGEDKQVLIKRGDEKDQGDGVRKGWTTLFCFKFENSMVINTSEEAIQVYYTKCVAKLLKRFALVKK